MVKSRETWNLNSFYSLHTSCPAALKYPQHSYVKLASLLCSCQASFRNAKQDREGWLLLNELCMVNRHIRSLTSCLSGSSSFCWCWLLAAVINVSNKQTHTGERVGGGGNALCFTSICTNTSRQAGSVSLTLYFIFIHTHRGMRIPANPSHTLEWSLDLYFYTDGTDPHGWLSDKPGKYTHGCVFITSENITVDYIHFLKTNSHPNRCVPNPNPQPKHNI